MFCFVKQEGFGLYVTRVVAELLRDRKEVVERITRKQIDSFLSLLKKYEVNIRTTSTRGLSYLL